MNSAVLTPPARGSPMTGASLVLIFISIILLILLILAGYYLVVSCSGVKKPFMTFLTDLQFDPCYGDETPKELTQEAKQAHTERKYEHEKEVFHINDQIYTYEQAACKCNTYGAVLATNNQIIDAYNQGANWCGYGWSAGQQAFYPSQPAAFYERLATNPRDWYVCGSRPGVIGGHFPANVQFGVNCYGVKPAGQLSVPKPTPPPTMNQVCKIVGDFDSNNKLRSDNISPFNQNQFSVYSN